MALSQMALPPCHSIVVQFYVRESKYLDCQMYQRSGDIGLGVPFNIASYSILVYMIAHVTNLQPGKFIHIIGDAHIYINHVDGLKTQLERVPYSFPRLLLTRRVEKIDDFKVEDFKLVNYESYPPLKLLFSV